jgi:hypothetical protein
MEKVWCGGCLQKKPGEQTIFERPSASYVPPRIRKKEKPKRGQIDLFKKKAKKKPKRPSKK